MRIGKQHAFVPSLIALFVLSTIRLLPLFDSFHSVEKQLNFDNWYTAKLHVDIRNASTAPIVANTYPTAWPNGTIEALIASTSTIRNQPPIVETTSHNIAPKKPIMILHVGPYKHGTTFLQCVLSGSGYELLLKDNYVYLGSCLCADTRNARTGDICLGHSARSLLGETENNLINPVLLRHLPRLRDEGRNAMIVWEYLSDSGRNWIHAFAAALEGWEVRVIAAYRPAFEFLPSFLAQVQMPYGSRPQYRAWPSQGGQAIVPFDIYSKEELTERAVSIRYQSVFQRMVVKHIHPTKSARRLWREVSPNVRIVDMSQLGPPSPAGGNPLLIHVFCSLLEDTTPTMCNAARNNELPAKTSNARFPINYDLLAMAAFERGLVTEVVPRPVVWGKIKERQESHLKKTSFDFPLACPSNFTSEQLLKLSISVERLLFSKVDEDAHRQRFLSAVQQNAFCHIDTDAVLADKAWRTYLSGIGDVCGGGAECPQLDVRAL